MMLYDAILNFLEVNKLEYQILQDKIQEDETKAEERFKQQVSREIHRQIMMADTLLNQRFLSVQPELVVEANQTRAKYYLCTQQLHYTQKLVDEGAIRDKHAKPILIDVNKNIAKLKLKRPKYRNIPFGNLLMNSPLYYIFGEDVCKKLLKSHHKTRQILQSKKMVEPNEVLKSVFFVTRGSILESSVDMTENGVQTIVLDFELGCCAGLQYVHPIFESQSRTTLACNETNHAQVVNFDITIL